MATTFYGFGRERTLQPHWVVQLVPNGYHHNQEASLQGLSMPAKSQVVTASGAKVKGTRKACIVQTDE
jgi:hypothetical protein